MKFATKLLLILLIAISSLRLDGQITVQLIVNSGSSDTNCGDLFDAPDPGWLIQVDTGSYVRYAGNANVGGCYIATLPNLQYEQTYNTQAEVPISWQVCFRADEHDPWLGCGNAQCVESICEELNIPAIGSSVTYTLTIPQTGNSSWGSTSVTIITSGAPVTPPTAGFTADPTSGCAPLSVQFSDQSSDNTTSWSWTFEGGQPASSSEQNPSVNYLNPGIYGVTLVASNSAGSDTLVQQNFIEVSSPPTATFGVSLNLDTLSLSNNSSNANTYLWDFGDGNTDTTANPPAHVYAEDGSYTVVLIATNDCGSDTSSMQINISTQPIGSLDVDGFCKVSVVYPPGDPNNSNTSGRRILQLPDGNFLIGGTQNEEAFLRKVDAEGNTLIMQSYGSEIGDTSALQDIEAAPDGGFVITGTYKEYTETDTTTGVYVLKTDADLNIDMSIGVKKFTAARKRNPRLCKSSNSGYMLATAYGTPGNLSITELSENLDSSWSVFYNLGFLDLPGEITPTQQGYAVFLNNIAWNLEILPGILLHIDTAGQMLWSSVTPPAIMKSVQYLSSSQQILCAGMSEEDPIVYLFDASTGQLEISNNLPATTYRDIAESIKLLDNGNLIVTVRQNVSFISTVYSNVYRLSSNDLSVIDSITITHDDSPYFIAAFDIVPTGCDGRSFALVGSKDDNESALTYPFFYHHYVCDTVIHADQMSLCEGDSLVLQGPESADSYLWSTGETTQSILVSQAGTYSLTIETDCQVFTDVVTISGESVPMADFSTSIYLDTLFVYNTTSDADSYFWDFGDGTTSTEAYPAPHVYAESNTYTITLIATNDCGSDTITQEIDIVAQPKSNFTADVNSGCAPLSVQFTDLSTGTPTSWQWTFEGGTPATSTEQNPQVEYLSPGLYSVTLTVMNATGSDMLIQSNYIEVLGIPSSNFTYSQDGFTISFVSSTSSGTHFWDFGDGQTANVSQPVHTYSSGGSYTVIHTVSNACGETTTEQTLVISTATEETEMVDVLQVFPNPFSEQLFIEAKDLRLSPNAVWQVELVNISGQIVRQAPLPADLLILDTVQLPSGTYLLRILKDGKQLRTYQLVKLR